MWFITVDNKNYITGLFNGKYDYVHRITGEPMENGKRIPDEAIRISKESLKVMRDPDPLTVARYDPDNNVVYRDAANKVTAMRRALLNKNTEAVIRAEQLRIRDLTREQLTAELGA